MTLSVQRFGQWLRSPDNGASLLVAAGGCGLLATRQGFLVPFTTGLPPVRVAALLGLAVLLLGLAGGRRYCFERLFAIPLVPLVVTLGLTVATLLSVARVTTGQLNQHQMEMTSHAVRDAFVVLSVFIVVVSVINTRESVVLVLRGLVLGASISSAMAFVTRFTGYDVAPLFRLPGLNNYDEPIVTNLMRDGVVRPQGSAAHPLELSSVLTVLTPVAVALAFEAHKRGARWRPWALCTLLLIGGAVLTVSRSALVGAAISLLVFCLYWPLRRAAIVLVCGGLITAITWLYSVPILSQMLNVVTNGSNDGSLQSRAVGREYVLQNFGHNLWLGQGAGTYDLTSQPVLDNNYLSELMQAGVLGLGGTLVFYMVGIYSAIKASRRGQQTGFSDIGPGLLAAILVALTVGLILDLVGFAQMSLLPTILVALAVCAARVTATNSRVTATSSQVN
ncbi:O-antigen ligase family protein [Gordonia otitidis]|nr:O-antigen ligase family protein [Gordonia otitidis]